MYLLFIDLTKAFDNVRRPDLWSILWKLGCPPKCINMVRSLHDGMMARVIENGDVSDPFPVTNGVKQGCVLAPALFSLLLAEMLSAALTKRSAGTTTHYRTDGRFFDLRRLKANTKVQEALVRDFLFANDCALAAHSEEDLQCLADCFSTAAMAFSLTVSIKKTEVLCQAAPGTTQPEPSIKIDGAALKNVEDFTYLGSCLSSSGGLDAEIFCQLSKTSNAFGCLWTRVWREGGITQAWEACCLQSCSPPNLSVWLRHLDMLPQTPQKTGPVPLPLPPQALGHFLGAQSHQPGATLPFQHAWC